MIRLGTPRIVAAALLGLACLVAEAGVLPAAPARPNFLWLIAEDFSPHLGCYGARQVWTPNLDRLAAAGVRYDRCYTTAPVCSPSRSAFMTGLYATTLGAQHHRTRNKAPLPEGVKILSDWFRDAGYFTANLVELPPAFGFKGAGKTDWNFAYTGRPFDSRRWDDLKSRQPFFAQINFHETHRKFNGPARADPAKVELPPYYPDHAEVRADYARYLDAASELDRKIGLLLAQLETDGLASNTVVVFMGDNGEAHARGKQFCYEEGLRVPLLIRWPGAFPAPKHFAAGTVDRRLLQAIDVGPTLLALAGAAPPPRMQGRVFLGDRAAPPREYVFGARDRCDETLMALRTARDDRYRYIRNFMPEVPLLASNKYKAAQYPAWNLIQQLHAEGRLTAAQAALCAPRMPAEELFDLAADPHQTNNLAQSPAFEGTRLRLRAALEEWMKSCRDPWLDPARAAADPESRAEP